MNTLTGTVNAFQLSDAAQTCVVLRKGGYERNPLLPQNCGAIVAIKSATLIPLFTIKDKRANKIWAISMMASGGVGISLSIKSW